MTEQFPSIYGEHNNDAEVNLFDTKEPRSLVNIVWKDFRPVVERVRDGAAHLFELSEDRLKKKASPEILHTMLRMRFWQEYDIAQSAGRRMMQKDVTRGLCTAEYWSRSICPSAELVAYMITPPPKYINKMEAMLDISMDEILAILELPIKNAQGKIDIGLIKEKVKIFQSLDLRVKGAVLQKVAIHQRIDQRTQIQSADSVLDSMSLTDLEALDSTINKVKKQIERTQNREMILLESPKPKEGVVEDGSENLGSEEEGRSNEASEVEEDKIP